MKKLIYFLMSLSFISVFALCSYIGYVLLYPFPTLTMSNITFASPQVIGKDFSYHTKYCVYKADLPYSVNRYLRSKDGKNVVPFPPVRNVLEIPDTKDGCSEADVSLPIISDIKPNTYQMTVDVDVNILSVRHIHIINRSNYFEIK